MPSPRYWREIPSRLRLELTGYWDGVAFEPTLSLYEELGRPVATWSRIDGSFAVAVVGAGSVRAQLSMRGGIRWIGGNSYSEATELVLAPGQEFDLGTIEISAVDCRLVRSAEWASDQVGQRRVVRQPDQVMVEDD